VASRDQGDKVATAEKLGMATRGQGASRGAVREIYVVIGGGWSG
jgi:hypothetical protein